jgi:hypothetical protein
LKRKPLIFLVPEARLELAQGFPRGILSAFLDQKQELSRVGFKKQLQSLTAYANLQEEPGNSMKNPNE